MADKLKVRVKPLAVMDLLAFKNLIPKRKKMFDGASTARPAAAPVVNELAKRLHPVRQYLTVAEVTEETPDVKSFRLVPDASRGTKELAVFRAGQYLSVKLDVEGERVTRPYSIASSPKQALDGFYTLTVKRAAFATDYIWDNWKKGAQIEVSGPEGQFYCTRLRDLPHIAGIAGGSGITPFLSILRDFSDRGWPVDFTLFYGCNVPGEIVRRTELDALAEGSGGKLTVVYVIADGPAEPGMETGFVTKQLIEKYVDPAACSFFICGPQAMYAFVSRELSSFSLPVKQIRFEVFGEAKNVAAMEGYPQNVPESFTITATLGGKTVKLPALARESVLTALERAKLSPPSKCRSGQCGFCRTRLVAGDVFVPAESDGRRGADKKFGVIHACSAWPLSDLTVEIPCDEL